MYRLKAIWKKVDPVHPLEARFFDESIQEAYSEYTSMLKIIGIALLAISSQTMRVARANPAEVLGDE